MYSGSEFIGLFSGSKLKNVDAPDVISTGAVSPMARAMPRMNAVARPGRASAAPRARPSPLRRAEREARLPQAARHDPQHDLRRPRDDRQHHHAQGHPGSEALRWTAQGNDQERVDEQSGNDVGQRGHRLDHCPDDLARPAADLGHVDRVPRPSGSETAVRCRARSASRRSRAGCRRGHERRRCGADAACVKKFRWCTAGQPLTDVKPTVDTSARPTIPAAPVMRAVQTGRSRWAVGCASAVTAAYRPRRRQTSRSRIRSTPAERQQLRRTAARPGRATRAASRPATASSRWSVRETGRGRSQRPSASPGRLRSAEVGRPSTADVAMAVRSPSGRRCGRG